MDRPTREQVEHAQRSAEGWSYTGSDKVMPATGWEKFEILAAELRALRAENERLEGLVSKWEANYDEGIKAQFERAKAHLAFSSIGIDRDDVDALVKAARALVDAYDKHDYAGGNGPALAHEVNAVCDALKPFEE